MDDGGFEQLEPWLHARETMPVGPLFCVINGPTRGRPWSPAAARAELRRTAATAGVRRRFAVSRVKKMRQFGALEVWWRPRAASGGRVERRASGPEADVRAGGHMV
jgi:hypothetical protein